jgi:DNA repair photolyase
MLPSIRVPRPVSNPPNPWASQHVEWLEEPPSSRLEVFEEEAKSVLSENKSPDLHFRFSVNPYRGCIHACAYCYARPSHQYLGYGAGTDFDRKIVAKINAPEVLRRELERGRAGDDAIVFSGNTDCYQGLEASYELTRRCLEACRDTLTPVNIITKGALVARDVALLGEIRDRSDASVFVSIPLVDDEVARAIEPWASRPSLRLKALETLSKAGIRTGVSVSPIIPGLNDATIPSVLAAARDAGATKAFVTLLRLPAEVEPVFTERIRAALPLRADKILRAVREMRGGERMNDARFGSRMRGQGERWTAIEQLFHLHAKRLGIETSRLGESVMSMAPVPKKKRQLQLFDDSE